MYPCPDPTSRRFNIFTLCDNNQQPGSSARTFVSLLFPTSFRVWRCILKRSEWNRSQCDVILARGKDKQDFHPSFRDSFRFRNIFLTFSLTKYFSLRHKLWDEVKHTLRLHDLVESDYVRMVEQLHDLDLPVDLSKVGGVQLGLVYDFDCDLKLWTDYKQPLKYNERGKQIGYEDFEQMSEAVGDVMLNSRPRK